MRKNKKNKKMFGLLLCLFMMLQCLPSMVFAQAEENGTTDQISEAAASVTIESVTTYYLTVQAALDAATQAESATISLLRSDENVSGLFFSNATARLEMNGFTLKGDVVDNGIIQLLGAKLTVVNGTIENTGSGGYGINALYDENTHHYSTIAVEKCTVIGKYVGINTKKAHVNVAESTVKGTAYGIRAMSSGGITLESGTIQSEIGVKTSINGGIIYLGAEGSNGPIVYGETYGINSHCDVIAYSGTISCPSGIGISIGEQAAGPNDFAGAGLFLEGTPIIEAKTDIYIDYPDSLWDKECIRVNVQLPDGAYSVGSREENEVIAIPGNGITLKRTYFTSADDGKYVQYGMHGNLYLGPCAHGDKKGVQNADGLTHDIFCNICLTTPEEDVSCSGGAATCTSKAVCTVCGELYGDFLPHTKDETLGQTCKGYFCTVCRAFYGATLTNGHKFNSATGRCFACENDMAAASVTLENTTTYYETLNSAIAAAAVGTENTPATVTVLKNIDLSETITVTSGVFTLNLNGKTLRDYEKNGLFDGLFNLPYNSTAHMTIADTEGGKMLADWAVIKTIGGAVTISGGEFGYEGSTTLGNSVSAYGGKLNISGGIIYSVATRENTDVNISGGKFKMINCHNTIVKELLADGYSYWNLEGNVMLSPEENETIISKVSVKATCYHPKEKLYFVDKGDGTHDWRCSDCLNTGNQPHSYAVDTHQCACGVVEKFMVSWYNGNGGNYEKEYEFGAAITVPTGPFFEDTFRKTGHTLIGFEGYTEGMTMPGSDITVTAIYEINTYTITFNTDGGSYVAPITQKYATAVTAPAVPSKDGYHFVKWENLPVAMPAQNLTVKAVWEAHYGGEATCISGKICESCYTPYTNPDLNKHSEVISISQEGDTATITCDDCDIVLKRITLLAPKCKVYGDNKSSEATVLVDDNLVDTMQIISYFKWENGQWEKIETAPADAGRYRAETSYGDATSNDFADDFTLFVEYTIEKANITITADSKVIYAGENLPAFTYTVSGLVNGDELTKEPALKVDADADKAGSYTIIIANAEAGDNYIVAYVNGNLTIVDKKTEVETKIEQAELTEVPNGLKNTRFDTVEKITEEMISKVLATFKGYSAENMDHYNVELYFSLDGGESWILATEENFPTEGITMIFPYPEGTNARDYDFVVSHMFTVTSERLGTVAGEIEMPKVEETKDGIKVTLNGLSPVTIASKYNGHTGDTPETSDDSNVLLHSVIFAVTFIALILLYWADKKRKHETV